MKHQSVQASIDKHRGAVSHQTNITKQKCNRMHIVTRTNFPVLRSKLWTECTVIRFCKLLTTVAILYGGTCLNSTTPLVIRTTEHISSLRFCW